MDMNPTPSKSSDDLAARLGPAHVGLRPDLEVHRHLFRSEPTYVIRDPLTLQCHRLNGKEYEILVHLRSDRSLEEVFDALMESGKLQRESQDDFYQFIATLQLHAFLHLPFSNDKALYQPYQAGHRAKRKEKLLGFLFLRIPLINPDAFLNKTLHLARPLFSRWFLAVWVLLMIVGISIGLLERQELMVPLSGALTTGNLICLWISLILLKVFHEFGHAYA